MNRALLLTLFFAACGPEQQLPQVTPEVPVEQEEVPVQTTTTTPLTGFPCDVREVLQTNCAACHAGAVYVTHFDAREDLLAPGRETETLGIAVALRLRPDAQSPMPPVNAPQQPTLAQRQLIENWVSAGMPGGECGPLDDR